MTYKVTFAPADAAEWRRWVEREFQKLEQELTSAQQLMRLAPTTATPDKPRDGDIRYADGTNWNPFSGEGFYGYYAGSWVKLG